MESGVGSLMFVASYLILNKIVNKVFCFFSVLGEKPTPVHNVVAPVVVIGSLVIGLLLILIYRWKRKSE